MSKELNELLRLLRQLPDGLRSDWDGTNHYELTSYSTDEHFWLMVGEGLPDGNSCETETGKRFGLIMDIAVAVKDAEAQIADLARLTSENERYRTAMQEIGRYVDGHEEPGYECVQCLIESIVAKSLTARLERAESQRDRLIEHYSNPDEHIFVDEFGCVIPTRSWSRLRPSHRKGE